MATTATITATVATSVVAMDTWPVLPQYLISSAGVLYEGFENAGDWTISGGSAAANTSEYKTGSQSVKFTTNSGASLTATKTVNWDLSGDWHSLDFWYYVHNSTLSDYASELRIKLANDSGISNNYWYNAALRTGISGWKYVSIPKTYFTQQGAGTWSDPIIRVRFEFTASETKVGEVSIDDLIIGNVRVPTIIFRFDDGYTSQYTAYQYLAQYRIGGSISCETDYHAISWAQYQEMDAARWAVCNHTNSATNLTTKNLVDQQAQINGGITDLTDNSLSRCSLYVIYPGGGFNADTRTACGNLGILLGGNTGDWGRTSGAPGPVLPKSDPLDIGTHGIDDDTVAEAEAMLDEAMDDRTVAVFHFHEFGGSGPWTLSEFYEFVDYARTKMLAGQLYPITYDDYYKLSLGPVMIPSVYYSPVS